MRWMIKVGNDTLGPVEENAALEILRANPTAQVRGEGGGRWMAAADSPFANHITPPPAPSRQGAAPKGGSIKFKVIIVLIIVSILWTFASANGWLGILIGLVLGAWTVERHRKGRPSLLSVVLNRGHGILMTGGTIMVAVGLVLVGGKALLAARERELVTELTRKAEEAQQAATENRRNELKDGLLTQIDTWRHRLVDAARTADEAGGLATATKLTTAVTTEIVDATKLLDDDGSALKPIRQESEKQVALLEARATLPKNVADVADAITTGKKHASSRAWAEADQAYDAALAVLSDLERRGEALVKYYPAGFDPAVRRAEVDKLKARIAAPLAQEKKRLAKEEEKRKEKEAKDAAYRAICGPEPVLSPFDGEVVGLESALQETAHDPDSIDVENCTTPRLTSDECWTFACNVRGKNAFGALILTRKTFSHSNALGFVEK